jgi:hypothetical protein
MKPVKPNAESEWTKQWMADPKNVGMMRDLAAKGRLARGDLPTWANTTGTPIEEVWGDKVPEWWKLLSASSPGVGISQNIGVANKAMAERAAGLPFTGTGYLYPANARKAMEKVLRPAEKPLGNPKTFTMEMMQNADLSPFDTLRFWEKMMGAPAQGFPAAPGLPAHVEFHRALRDNVMPKNDPRWKGLQDFTADMWSGVESKASGAPVAVEMEKRIQRARVFRPPEGGKGSWVKRDKPITRDEVIQAMRKGEAWAVGLIPAPMLYDGEKEQK